MDVDTLVQRLIKALDESIEINISALRNTSSIEDVKYIQGMLDTMDDMKSRILTERKKLTKETLFDDEND